MQLRVAVIAGDGIGPAVMHEACETLRLACAARSIELQLDWLPFGADHYLATGIALPADFVRQARDIYSAILFGAVGDPRITAVEYGNSILIRLRKELDLYVNLRPFCYPQLNRMFQPRPANFIVVRENTEDLYSGSGGLLSRGGVDLLAVENAVFTRTGVERIIRHAFRCAAQAERRSVTLCDKSNVMRFAGKLWTDCFGEIGALYPAIQKHHMYVDALCMELVRDPSRFEVIVTSNLFGDILSDVAAQVVGGLGLCPSASYNPEEEAFLGLFEPIHGSAPGLAGANQANPIGAILSAALLLQRAGVNDGHDAIVGAVCAALTSGVRTRDLDGESTTTELGRAIRRRLGGE